MSLLTCWVRWSTGGCFRRAVRLGGGAGRRDPQPDGTRWLGISALHVVPRPGRRGLARDVRGIAELGHHTRATRSYVQVLVENAAAIALYESLGYRLHHHLRYVDARAPGGRSL